MRLVGLMAWAWASPPEVPPPPAVHAALALRHAPIHYQDVDDAHPEADALTAVDYDGNRIATDNWEHLYTGDRSGVVYYSVVEGCTHWFVIYGFFHPRDWSAGWIDQAHENDLEGILVVVPKAGAGTVEAAVTVFHRDFYSYTAASSAIRGGAEDIDGTIAFEMHEGTLHPKTHQQAGGHGVKMWPHAARTPAASRIVYRPSLGAGGVPGSGPDRDVAYRLVDLFAPGGLWALQLEEAAARPAVGLFHHFGTLRGDAGGTCGTEGARWCARDAANLPWGWDDTGFAPFSTGDGAVHAGEMALDPAHLVEVYFSGLGAFSRDYLDHRYATSLRDAGYTTARRPDGMSPDLDLDGLYAHLVSACL